MWMAMCKKQGIYIFPGMPNGTEIGQECDQLFSYVKMCLYTNRDLLWSMICQVLGTDKAELVLDDFGPILFGGEVVLSDGSTLVLQPAFETSLQPRHIKKAREACGYCPATRSALRSDKLRHEIVETTDGIIDEDADPYGCLLASIEKDNLDACQKLIDAGYPKDAVLALHKIANRVTAAQVHSRETTRTIEGTRERQDLLTKIKSAGQFFWVTGGAAMNSSDVLLAHARKEMTIAADSLKARRQTIKEFAPIKAAYKKQMEKLLKENVSPEQWNNKEFKSFIRQVCDFEKCC
jgi:hypothetical protein